MKYIAAILTILFISININYAQQSNQSQNIEPEFVVEDVIFVYQSLMKIDIKGSEADKFLTIKKLLEDSITRIQQQEMKPGDKITINMELTTAQDIINFMQRATFKGAEAVSYKRFIEALKNAAKKLQSETNE